MTSASLFSRPTGFASGSSRPSLWQRTVRIVQYRSILRLLIARDLKVRYAGSLLGYVWTVLDPLLMSIVYWFIFTKIFQRSAGVGFEPFLLYLVSGQLAWAWFSGGVSGVSRALRSEAQMVRSSNVPRELWVLRVVASKGVEYLFSLPVLVIFAVVYTKTPSRYTWLLPVGWVMEAMLIVGVGLILAPCTVLFKDLERIVPIVMRVLFYASPILYSVGNVPASVRSVFSVNPTVGFLTATHAVFFPKAIVDTRTATEGATAVLDQATARVRNGEAVVGGKAHLVGGHEVTHTVTHWDWMWHSALATGLILAIGVVVFVRLERPVLKEI